VKDKKSFAFVDEFLSSGRWTVVVAGWGLGIFETKESAEHCARDINQAHADGIKEAETCRESGGTDSVCLKGHEDSMKEVRERERKAVAERDARIAALEKELSEWKESARVEAEEGDRARARIAELEKVLVGASEYIEGLAKRTGVLHGNIPEIRKALGKGER